MGTNELMINSKYSRIDRFSTFSTVGEQLFAEEVARANREGIYTFIYKQRENSNSRLREIFLESMKQTWEKLVILYAIALTILGKYFFLKNTVFQRFFLYFKFWNLTRIQRLISDRILCPAPN